MVLINVGRTMSEIPMNSEGAEVPQAGLVAPGAQLKAQREALGWTVAHVAEQLKLAPRQVVALEEGDAAALPNRAVVRGFVRAYAKVVRLDAVPLVAMIEVNPAVSATPAPARREIPATFSQVRFSSLTQRSSMSKRSIVAALLVAAAAAVGAYKLGLIPPSMLMRGDKAAGASDKSLASAISPLETGNAKPAQETPPAPSPSVPLISVPTPPSSAPASAPAPNPPLATPAVPAAPLAVTPVAAALPLAAAQADMLVLTAHQASWVELRRVGATPLISRVIKAGSTETFKVTEPLLLIVGTPAGVDATLRGVRLELPPGPSGKATRVNIK